MDIELEAKIKATKEKARYEKKKRDELLRHWMTIVIYILLGISLFFALIFTIKIHIFFRVPFTIYQILGTIAVTSLIETTAFAIHFTLHEYVNHASSVVLFGTTLASIPLLSLHKTLIFLKQKDLINAGQFYCYIN